MSKIIYRDIEAVSRQLIFYRIEGDRLDEFGLMKAHHFPKDHTARACLPQAA